ncbi:MAG TPA: ABC transporter permease [Bryobacteraceae bacterium]|nr:ABC transporter permease [Bryobacteraceae bacterium]
MSLLSRCASLWRGIFRRGGVESDMEVEMRFHMAAYVDDQVRAGVPREQAERRARVEFGSVQGVKENCREARGLRLFDELRQDLRYAARMLKKTPGFTLVSVLTLAVGIGANTSIFSLVDTFVLRPLPFPDPGRLIVVSNMDTKRGGIMQSVSPADITDWSERHNIIDGITGWTSTSFALAGATQAEAFDGALVNSNFFHILGVSPGLGRDFTSADDVAGAAPVALISDTLWRNRFAADRSIAGRSIMLDDRAVTIIGVIPPNFHVPLLGRADIWMPLSLSEAARHNRAGRWLRTIGRVQPGVSVATARAYLVSVSRRLAQAYPETNTNRGAFVRTLRDQIADETQSNAVLLMFGIVGCVLLIACTNVANLMITRATNRQREMAIRLAIGAGRFRLMRQVLTENVLLFLLGGGLSVLFAVYGVKWLGHLIPSDVRVFLPNEGQFSIDTPVLFYTFAIAMIAGLIFGFAPAFNCARGRVGHSLKETGSKASANMGSARLRKSLVVFELALAVIVLVASGLLIKSILRIYTVDPGFQTGNLLTARILLPRARYKPKGRAQAFYADVLGRIRRLPQVKAAEAGLYIPFDSNNSTPNYMVEGRPASRPGESPYTEFTVVTPGYHAAMGIPLITGRYLSERDGPDSQHVVVINRTMAEKEWPDADPIGKRIQVTAGPGGDWLTIVGVVGNVKLDTLMERPEPQVYLPNAQFNGLSMYLVVRTQGKPDDVFGAVQTAVSEVDRGQPLHDVATMEKRLSVAHIPNIVIAQAMSAFATIALFLAAIGIYGVVSYSVAARRQEIGVRMALGASVPNVLSLVVGQGLRLTAVGLAVGLAGSAAVGSLLATLLFRVSPRDLSIFGFVSALLGLIAVIACYIPARRAAALDPLVVLRYE